MKGARRLAAALAGFALLLPLAGCGKYGKPVRKSRSFAASFGAEGSGAVHDAVRHAFREGAGDAQGRAQEMKRDGR